MPWATVRSILALHVFPLILLPSLETDAVAIARSRGLFTGAQSSTMLAQIVIDYLIVCTRLTLLLSSHIWDSLITYAAYVDNLCFIGHCLA